MQILKGQAVDVASTSIAIGLGTTFQVERLSHHQQVAMHTWHGCVGSRSGNGCQGSKRNS